MINDFDILLLIETWNSNVTNIDIDGFENYNCPRPKANKKAKRDRGGVFVYYKECYRNFLELLSVSKYGVVWFKLKHEIGSMDNDIYICTCYIPPEGSSVYKNVASNLYTDEPSGGI